MFIHIITIFSLLCLISCGGNEKQVEYPVDAGTTEDFDSGYVPHDPSTPN